MMTNGGINNKATMVLSMLAPQFSSQKGRHGNRPVQKRPWGEHFIKQGLDRYSKDNLSSVEEARQFALELFEDPKVQTALKKTLETEVIPEMEIAGKDILDLLTAPFRHSGKASQAVFDPIVFERQYYLSQEALEKIHVVLAELQDLGLFAKVGDQYRCSTGANRDLDDYYFTQVVLKSVFPSFTEESQLSETPLQHLENKAKGLSKLMSWLGLAKQSFQPAQTQLTMAVEKPYTILSVHERLLQGLEERRPETNPPSQLEVRALAGNEALLDTLIAPMGSLKKLVELLSLMQEGFPSSLGVAETAASLSPEYMANKGHYSQHEKQALIKTLENLLDAGLVKKEFNGNRYWLTPMGEASVQVLMQKTKREDLLAGKA